MNYEIRIINKELALYWIKKFHYSNTLPAINKYYLGYYVDNEMVGCITLGYGTRPRHTIELLFSDVNTNEYLEIGRMCMDEKMPRNSESKMLSVLVKWIRKNIPKLKVLFTWADGMMGKPGYVYQACSFEYCGFSWTDTYMYKGNKIHPRQMKHIIHDERESQIGLRPTKQQMLDLNISQYKGKQFKYAKILRRCNKKYIAQKYPKKDDLIWFENKGFGYNGCDKPNFISDKSAIEIKQSDMLIKQDSLF